MATPPKPLRHATEYPQTSDSPTSKRKPIPLPASSRHHKSLERTISVSQAKTHLLALLDEIDTRQEPVIITKRGRPVARIIPIEIAAPGGIFGCMKGTFKITGDIVGPEPDVWDALQ